jgi:oxysterol-binding protein-related protein 8
MKGFFSGTYNALSGRIRRNSSEVGEVSGRWSHVMEFKSVKVSMFDRLDDYRPC